MDGLHILGLSRHAPGCAGQRGIVAPTALANDDCLSPASCRHEENSVPASGIPARSLLPLSADRRKDAGAL
jgi:hypothetical protein